MAFIFLFMSFAHAENLFEGLFGGMRPRPPSITEECKSLLVERRKEVDKLTSEFEALREPLIAAMPESDRKEIRSYQSQIPGLKKKLSEAQGEFKALHDRQPPATKDELARAMKKNDDAQKALFAVYAKAEGLFKRLLAYNRAAYEQVKQQAGAQGIEMSIDKFDYDYSKFIYGSKDLQKSVRFGGHYESFLNDRPGRTFNVRVANQPETLIYVDDYFIMQIPACRNSGLGKYRLSQVTPELGEFLRELGISPGSQQDEGEATAKKD